MKHTLFTRIVALSLCLLLVWQQAGIAQVAGSLDLSLHLRTLHSAFTQEKFRPLHLRSLSYDAQANNFKLLLDKGEGSKPISMEEETKQLLNYFFIGVSLPNQDFWVNLRPDSPDHIIDPLVEKTDIGRVFLETDLQLKKDTAAATSPQTPQGREYWDRLYAKAQELFGYESVTIPTLTRPWIVPGEIIIRETSDNAYIYKATLKVMLEEDYLKAEDSSATPLMQYQFKDPRSKALNQYSSQLIRQLIIPALTRQVNTSKRYAALRQVYYSLILAQWFKERYRGREGLYSRLINQQDLTNLTSKTPWSKDTYFKGYQESFTNGEYNLKEPQATPFGQTIRSYFSGGISTDVTATLAPALQTLGTPIQQGPTSTTVIESAAINPALAPFLASTNNPAEFNAGQEVGQGDLLVPGVSSDQSPQPPSDQPEAARDDAKLSPAAETPPAAVEVDMRKINQDMIMKKTVSGAVIDFQGILGSGQMTPQALASRLRELEIDAFGSADERVPWERILAAGYRVYVFVDNEGAITGFLRMTVSDGISYLSRIGTRGPAERQQGSSGKQRGTALMDAYFEQLRILGAKKAWWLIEDNQPRGFYDTYLARNNMRNRGQGNTYVIDLAAATPGQQGAQGSSGRTTPLSAMAFVGIFSTLPHDVPGTIFAQFFHDPLTASVLVVSVAILRAVSQLPRPAPSARPATRVAENEIIADIDTISSLVTPQASLQDLDRAYQLKLVLLQKLGVFSHDKAVLYPLIGSDVRPADFAPVIGVDMEFGEDIGYGEGDLSQGVKAVNIQRDVLGDLGGLEQSIRNKLGGKEVGCVFIKGWAIFLAFKALGKRSIGDIFKNSDAFLEMLDRKFIPPGGFIVLFAEPELAEKLKRRFGYADFLKEQIPPAALQKLNAADRVEEIRVSDPTPDPQMTRKLVINGRMIVLQKPFTRTVPAREGQFVSAQGLWAVRTKPETTVKQFNGAALLGFLPLADLGSTPSLLMLSLAVVSCALPCMLGMVNEVDSSRIARIKSDVSFKLHDVESLLHRGEDTAKGLQEVSGLLASGGQFGELAELRSRVSALQALADKQKNNAPRIAAMKKQVWDQINGAGYLSAPFDPWGKLTPERYRATAQRFHETLPVAEALRDEFGVSDLMFWMDHMQRDISARLQEIESVEQSFVWTGQDEATAQRQVDALRAPINRGFQTLHVAGTTQSKTFNYAQDGPIVLRVGGQYLLIRKSGSTGQMSVYACAQADAASAGIVVEGVGIREQTRGTLHEGVAVRLGSRSILVRGDSITVTDHNSHQGTEYATPYARTQGLPQELLAPVAAKVHYREYQKHCALLPPLGDFFEHNFDFSVRDVLTESRQWEHPLRAQLEGHLNVVMGKQSGDFNESADWLRKFFRMYHLVFYASQGRAKDGSRPVTCLIGRLIEYIPVDWNGFGRVCIVDTDRDHGFYTNAKGGFFSPSHYDEAYVIKEYGHPALGTALHEARHAFDLIEAARQGKSFHAWELEYTAYLAMLANEEVSVDVADWLLDRQFAHSVKFALAGESEEEHVRAIMALAPELVGRAARGYTDRVRTVTPEGMIELARVFGYSSIFEYRNVVLNMRLGDVAKEASEMLDNYYRQKFGMVPQYPDVARLPRVTVNLTDYASVAARLPAASQVTANPSAPVNGLGFSGLMSFLGLGQAGSGIWQAFSSSLFAAPEASWYQDPYLVITALALSSAATCVVYAAAIGLFSHPKILFRTVQAYVQRFRGRTDLEYGALNGRVIKDREGNEYAVRVGFAGARVYIAADARQVLTAQAHWTLHPGVRISDGVLPYAAAIDNGRTVAFMELKPVSFLFSLGHFARDVLARDPRHCLKDVVMIAAETRREYQNKGIFERLVHEFSTVAPQGTVMRLDDIQIVSVRREFERDDAHAHAQAFLERLLKNSGFSLVALFVKKDIVGFKSYSVAVRKTQEPVLAVASGALQSMPSAEITGPLWNKYRYLLRVPSVQNLAGASLTNSPPEQPNFVARTADYTVGATGKVLADETALFCNYLVIYDPVDKKAALIHTDNGDSVEFAQTVLQEAAKDAGIDITAAGHAVGFIARPTDGFISRVTTNVSAAKVEEVQTKAARQAGLRLLPSSVSDAWGDRKVRFLVDEGVFLALSVDRTSVLSLIDVRQRAEELLRSSPGGASRTGVMGIAGVWGMIAQAGQEHAVWHNPAFWVSALALAGVGVWWVSRHVSLRDIPLFGVKVGGARVSRARWDAFVGDLTLDEKKLMVAGLRSQSEYGVRRFLYPGDTLAKEHVEFNAQTARQFIELYHREMGPFLFSRLHGVTQPAINERDNGVRDRYLSKNPDSVWSQLEIKIQDLRDPKAAGSTQAWLGAGAALRTITLAVPVQWDQELASINTRVPAFLVTRTGAKGVSVSVNPEYRDLLTPQAKLALIASILEAACNSDPRFAALFANRDNAGALFGFDFVSDVKKEIMHGLYEREAAGQSWQVRMDAARRRAEGFIRQYLVFAALGKMLPATRKAALPDAMQRFPALEYAAQGAPERIVLEPAASPQELQDAASAGANVMVVEPAVYYEADASGSIRVGRYDDVQGGYQFAEKFVFARWKGQRYIFYISRSHTESFPGEAGQTPIHLWRLATQGIQGHWIIKQELKAGQEGGFTDVENLDDCSPALCLLLDKCLAVNKDAMSHKDGKAYVARVRDLGFDADVRHDAADIFMAVSRNSVGYILASKGYGSLRDYSGAPLFIRQAVEAKLAQLPPQADASSGIASLAAIVPLAAQLLGMDVPTALSYLLTHPFLLLMAGVAVGMAENAQGTNSMSAQMRVHIERMVDKIAAVGFARENADTTIAAIVLGSLGMVDNPTGSSQEQPVSEFNKIIQDELVGGRNVHEYMETWRTLFPAQQQLLAQVVPLLDQELSRRGLLSNIPSNLPIVRVMDCLRVVARPGLPLNDQDRQGAMDAAFDPVVERAGVAMRSTDHGKAVDLVNKLQALSMAVWSLGHAFDGGLSEYPGRINEINARLKLILSEGAEKSKQGRLTAREAVAYIEGMQAVLRDLKHEQESLHEAVRVIPPSDSSLAIEQFNEVVDILQSRIELATGVAVSTVYPLSQIINEACQGMDARIEGAVPALEIRGNRISLVTSLVNILSNARFFARKRYDEAKAAYPGVEPASPEVVVSFTQEADKVAITISNNGERIPAALLEKNQVTGRLHLFDLNESHRAGGTGLGTTEALYVVSDLKGSIDVTTTDTLTSFILRLPYVVAASQQVVASSQASAAMQPSAPGAIAAALALTDADRQFVDKFSQAVRAMDHGMNNQLAAAITMLFSLRRQVPDDMHPMLDSMRTDLENTLINDAANEARAQTLRPDSAREYLARIKAFAAMIRAHRAALNEKLAEVSLPTVAILDDAIRILQDNIDSVEGVPAPEAAIPASVPALSARANEIIAQMNASRGERPVEDYLLQLELLHELGLLKGNVLYPCMGVDYFPAYFASLFGLNLDNGIFYGDSVAAAKEHLSKPLPEAYQQRAWNPVFAARANFSRYEEYFGRLRQAGGVGVLFLKGFAGWGNVSTGGNQTRTREFIKQVNQELMSAGSIVILVGEDEDNAFGAMLRDELGYTDVLAQPEFLAAGTALNQRPYNHGMTSYISSPYVPSAFTVGRFSMRILRKPATAAGQSTGEQARAVIPEADIAAIDRVYSQQIREILMADSSFAPQGNYKPAAIHDIVQALQAVGLRPGQRVADIAGGDGRVSVIASLFGARGVSIEIRHDIWRLGSVIMRRLGSLFNRELVDYREGDMFNYSLRDNPADVVWYYDGSGPGIDRVESKILAECKPGTRVLIYGYYESSRWVPRLEKIGELILGYHVGIFRVPERSSPPTPAQSEHAPAPAQDSSASSPEKLAGVDFRALPIAVQGASRFIPGQDKGIAPAVLSSNKELQQLQRMVQSGMIPSTQRIVDYAQSCCGDDPALSAQQIGLVISCIAQVLRMEEDRCSATDDSLRRLLVLLESDAQGPQLQTALAHITVEEKEPDAGYID